MKLLPFCEKVPNWMAAVCATAPHTIMPAFPCSSNWAVCTWNKENYSVHWPFTVKRYTVFRRIIHLRYVVCTHASSGEEANGAEVGFEKSICDSNLSNAAKQGIYHRLGDTLARLHQWPEAERFHQAALEVQPDHVATHVSYGTMLARNVSFCVCGVCRCRWKSNVEKRQISAWILMRFGIFRTAEHPKLNYGSRELSNWLRMIPVYDITTVNIHNTSITLYLHWFTTVIWYDLQHIFFSSSDFVGACLFCTAEFLSSVSRHAEACEHRIIAAELSPDDYSLAVSVATALRLLDRKNEAEKWYRTVRSQIYSSIDQLLATVAQITACSCSWQMHWTDEYEQHIIDILL